MDDKTGTLHVYGQYTWHDDLNIIGDREGIELLRDLLTDALDKGAAFDHRCSFFQRDGEGFRVNVAVCGEDEMKSLSSAYNDWSIFDGTDGDSPCRVIESAIQRAGIDDDQ